APGRPPFAPGAGAPTGSGAAFGFCCRSTASVRTANRSGHRSAPRAGTHSHPGRVLLRVRRNDFGFCCRSTAPGANRERGGHRFASRAGPHSHPGRVLLRVRGGTFWFFAVGAPPRCEPRTKRAQIGVLGRSPFAPGAGAPTGSRAVLVFAV